MLLMINEKFVMLMRLRKKVLNIYSTHLCNWLSCSLETLYLRRGGGSPTLGLVNDDHDDCDDCYYDMNYITMSSLLYSRVGNHNLD